MARNLIYEQSARDDLRSIFWWIAERAGPEMARAYVDRIHDRCDRLTSFPEQGRPRNDIRPSLRTIPFERSAIVAYFTERKEVRIVRILRKGRDIEGQFTQSSSSS